MARTHMFLITVLLGAVFLAGVVAVSRTVLLGQPANASTSADPAITFRLKKLDRLEATLARRAGTVGSQRTPRAVTVFRHAVAPSAPAGDDAETEHDEGPDD